MKRALITGITGQDGSYLAELLLAKGYEVHGTYRPTSRPFDSPIRGLPIHLHHMDLTDPASIDRVMLDADPDEIYNLAAQSHVGTSFQMPAHTMEVTGLGALNIMDSYRRHAKHARFYQASSSEMFGNQPAPQSETTPFSPVSPYACAKVFAHNTAVSYREAYGLHISCGILFNHESPRRGENFVTRKITLGLARIKAWPARQSGTRQLVSAPGLGLRSRVRGSHVDDATAGHAGGFRDRNRRNQHGEGVS